METELKQRSRQVWLFAEVTPLPLGKVQPEAARPS